MAPRDWKAVLDELRPDVDELVRERTAFGQSHLQELLRTIQPSALRADALVTLRGLAFEATQRWRPTNEIDSFLELAIVDAHDACVDAVSAIQAGAGSPAVALLRRAYECMLILTAGWLDPISLEREMRAALLRPYTDDRYTQVARAGLLGAVMPSPRKLRDIGLAVGRTAREVQELAEIEAGFASFGHGGFLSGASYLTDGSKTRLESMLEMARAYDELMTHTVGLASAASSQIASRLRYRQVYGNTDSMFSAEIVERRENTCVAAFDDAFPRALDVLWATYLGLNSLNIEFAEYLGQREHGDPRRRQLLILTDGLETAWLATEYLFRGRLSGAATLIRRTFELGLEAQAWLRRSQTMTKRFAVSARPIDLAHDRTTPAATTVIRWLHGMKSSVLQRQTYSTLCSAAHGGAQAHEYVLALEREGIRVAPAPHFAVRHHRWLLGSLIGAVDSLLGAGLLLARQEDEEIFRNHWGYHEFFRSAQREVSGLPLVGHLDIDEIANPQDEPQATAGNSTA